MNVFAPYEQIVCFTKYLMHNSYCVYYMYTQGSKISCSSFVHRFSANNNVFNIIGLIDNSDSTH